MKIKYIYCIFDENFVRESKVINIIKRYYIFQMTLAALISGIISFKIFDILNIFEYKFKDVNIFEYD